MNQGWVKHYSHEGLSGHGVHNMSWKYEFPNSQPNTNVKVGYVSIQATSTGPNQNTEAYVGSASIQLGDNGAPGFGSISGPSKWVNQSAAPISFTASDSGLGVHSLTTRTGPPSESNNAPSPHSWKTPHGCIGVAGAACPRTWASTDAGPPTLQYDPSVLPTGINYLEVIAEDPVGNKSAAAYAQVKVDHNPPQAALSGTLTEQATLGIQRPSYTLRVDVSDGTTEQPQSGAAKTVIKVDGVVVDEFAPGCATKSCGITREWTLDASKYSAGQHTITVVATDGVGLTTTKTQTIELDPSPPALALSGTMTEQATLEASRPRYRLKLSASAQAGLEGTEPGEPLFFSSFGSAGTGDGQFNHPAGIAIDPKGNIWVVDQSNDRVQKFSAAGEYMSSFGSAGTGDGQFGRPTSIALDPKGNIWVADAGNHRIQKFSENGGFLAKFGSGGSGNGQFNGPEGIAIDPKGDIWVADTYNGRIQKFNENGEFIKVVGSKGSGSGQLGEPTDLDVGSDGSIWVADWQNNRVTVFSDAGQLVRQFGSYGAGDGQFNHPDVIDVDTKGNVWVADQNNGRVQQFSQSGEYLAQFGSNGSGDGQFSFGWPMGIATDSKGNIWVSDTANNRVQRWGIPHYHPTYESAFGSLGTGNGQLNKPADVVLDAEGNIWVADKSNNRIQKFNSEGEYLNQFGTLGSGDGQLNAPSALAIDAAGHIWVADKGNNRIQKFNANGEYLSKFGVSGTKEGQLSAPEGIAIDSGGNIWVSDGLISKRLQKFNPQGEFIKRIGTSGSSPGQLSSPKGIDIDANGKVWVADWQNHRISVFSEAGDFLFQFGSQGSGDGQFKRPDAIDVDIAGNVWVGDQENSRVQQFSQNGGYVTQFGAPGSDEGQLSLTNPLGIAADNEGNIWITDVNNNRVQKWSQSTSGSELATEILVDGTPVDAKEEYCIGEYCPVVHEWELDSEDYAVGGHTILARATDGLGNTSSKSLAIDIQRDTTNPTLQVNGTLAAAPEGWVEQKNYSLSASATDTGYGVTSINLRIDGEPVASASQACEDGGCDESFFKFTNMSTYSGGAHPAELIATDGAGNISTKKWTINVDPEGHISASEAEDTLDAADATSESTVVASTSDVYSAEERADGNNPSLVSGEEGNVLESRGTSNLSTISIDPEGGFTIDLPDSTLHVEPAHINEQSTPMIIGEDAAVASNTRQHVDTVVRPMFNGVTAFQSIRDATGPETYSWEVFLSEGQTLRSVDPQDAEVVYEDGTVAMLITAEPAHDAVGTNVPTSLFVSEGNIITLTVSHQQVPVVYPVVVGSGWEGGYTTEIIIGPKDEQEIKEEEERIAREKWEQMERQAEEEMAEGVDEPAVEYDDVKATGPRSPRRMYIAVGAPEMWDAGQRKRRSKFEASFCANLTCDYWHTWEWGTFFWNGVRGRVGGYAWRGNTLAKCATEADHPLTDTELHSVGWSGPNPAPYGYGKYLNFWCNFRFEWWNLEGPEKDYYQIQDHLYGSGYEGAHIKELPPPIILN